MIKWNKTSEVDVPMNQVFIGCGCEGYDYGCKSELYLLNDCFPMFKDEFGYHYAVLYAPLTTEPKFWTVDINLPNKE